MVPLSKPFWKFLGHASSVVGLIGAAISGFSYLEDHGYINVNPSQHRQAAISSTPQKPVTPVQPATPTIPFPTIESLYPPEQAITVTIEVYNPAPAFAADYVITSSGTGSASDVKISLWALIGTQFVKIDDRNVGYIGEGDRKRLRPIGAVISKGKFVSCLSYMYRNRHVDLMDFFSDDGRDPRELITGYPKFRDSISQLDSAGRLCNGMPQVAAAYIRGR